MGFKQSIRLGNVSKITDASLQWKETSTFDEKLIKNYDEICDEGYIFELDNEYPKNLHNVSNDLPFFIRKNEN